MVEVDGHTRKQQTKTMNPLPPPSTRMHTYLALPVLLHELMHGVAAGHPADEARVVGQGQDGVALNAEVHPRRLALAGQEGVDQPE